MTNGEEHSLVNLAGSLLEAMENSNLRKSSRAFAEGQISGIYMVLEWMKRYSSTDELEAAE